MEEQIVPADRRLRKQVLVGCAVSILLGMLAVHTASDYLHQARQLADLDPRLAIDRIRTLLTAVRMINLAISLALALYFGSIARRTLQSGRYPPEGMRVIRGTPIQTGSRAKVTAAACFSLALLLLSTNLLLWQLQNTIEKLLHK